MQRIGIETTQNVMLHQEVASIGDIMVAHIIDVLVKWGYIFLISMTVGSDWGFSNDDQLIQTLLIWAPFAFYHLASELIMNGQTVGKRLMKIKVARLDGNEPGLGQYLLRWLFRIVDVWLYAIGLFVILFNGKGQRLGDIVAGTTVVALKTRVKIEQTLMADLREGHQVRFPEAMRLNDQQAALIKEVLESRKTSSRSHLVLEMADRVSRAIGTTDMGPSREQYLRIVLNDYVYLTSRAGQPTTR